MTLSKLMQGITLKPNYLGTVTSDESVIAVNIGAPNSPVGSYVVAQLGITGLTTKITCETNDSNYIMGGISTTKTGTQRSFSLGGDRFIGDAFQDFCFSQGTIFGTGAQVIKDYVMFNVITGKGEKGKVSILVNCDAGGECGGSSKIDIELKQALTTPVEFTYIATAI